MTDPFLTIPSSDWLRDSSADRLTDLLQFLTNQGTFSFPILPNGLFSAIGSESDVAEVTGYRNVWLRDNIHIAWAHWAVQKDSSVPSACLRTLLEFYSRHEHRFDSIIDHQADADEPMNRPHIRFNGTDLKELDEKWSHAQNDALGYLLWLTCRLTNEAQFSPKESEWNILADVVHYFASVKYWQDEDSGHWEEVRKISASSIGTALAGLVELKTLLEATDAAEAISNTRRGVPAALLNELIARGRTALESILPFECIQEDPAKRREFDAALLFLIYPLNIVSESQADEILNRVTHNLQGPIGIRRYPGDSYWCADYKELLSADARTADFSDSLGARDALLKPGFEAQWCIFDPIISCIYGERFRTSGRTEDKQKQMEYLRRSLAQLTPVGSEFGAFRCPESYFCERGNWIPNDITPLLWTQANLWQALMLAADQ
ncbi:MAG: phosphorylase kinase [Planctomycetaceae bacterium]|nr:phosphorylase kinase [Planctomycetaceae bacterium]